MRELTLARLAKQLADRFERVGVDEEGAMEQDDRKLLQAVRAKAEAILTSTSKIRY